MAMTRALLSLTFVGVSFSLAACDKSSFKGASNKAPAAAPVVPATPAKPTTPQTADSVPVTPGTTTETFSITTNQGMIDMVWVIDNSGSMKEEAAAVRTNFSQFLTSVQSRTDMKIALISEREDSLSSISSAAGSTGVTLPDQFIAQGGIQVDSWIGSHDLLLVAAAATCGASDSDIGDVTALSGLGSTGGTNKICGQSLTFDTTESDYAVSAVGKLNGFFRPNSKKVFVVVSDDLAYGVDDTNFVELVKPALQNQAPTLFGFVGLDATRANCDIANVGTTYSNVAQATGGTMFDICDSDWSADFKKLSDNVVGIASSNFTVKAKAVASVVSAVIDGVAIDVSKIHVVGSVVTVDPAAIPAGAKSIVLTYKAGT